MNHTFLATCVPTRNFDYHARVLFVLSLVKTRDRLRKVFLILDGSKAVCALGYWCPHEESNLDLRLRRPTLDPLSYEDENLTCHSQVCTLQNGSTLRKQILPNFSNLLTVRTNTILFRMA